MQSLSSETRRDLWLVGVPFLVFLVALVPALAHARREYHDGLRRERLREVKRDLEEWYNRTSSFPAHPSGTVDQCGDSATPDDWFFVAHRQKTFGRTRLADPKNEPPYVFRYCPTASSPGTSPTATAFFLEATLENPAPESAGFNDEHNILERVLAVDGRSVHRICGGTEAQCGSVPPAAQ